jgi:hypothetical protein
MPSSARRIEPQSPDEEDDPVPAQGRAPSLPIGKAAGSEAFDTWFPVAWWVFKLLAWSSFLVVLSPRVLEYVGGRDLARWLLAHTWVRVLAVPVLGPLWLFSAFELRNSGRERAARSRLADAVGGTVAGTPRLDQELGLPDGPALRVPLGEWSMHVAAWVREGRRRTVARVTTATRTSFSFSARAAGSEPALLRGLQQAATASAMAKLTEESGDPARSASLATLAYLGDAPIETGHATLDRTVVLRANQPDTARDLLTAEPVQAALAAFDEPRRRWEWTLYPGTQPGLAELRFECSGGPLDEERVLRIRALLGPALEHLATAGVISRE